VDLPKVYAKLSELAFRSEDCTQQHLFLVGGGHNVGVGPKTEEVWPHASVFLGRDRSYYSDALLDSCQVLFDFWKECAAEDQMIGECKWDVSDHRISFYHLVTILRSPQHRLKLLAKLESQLRGRGKQGTLYLRMCLGILRTMFCTKLLSSHRLGRPEGHPVRGLHAAVSLPKPLATRSASTQPISLWRGHRDRGTSLPDHLLFLGGRQRAE